MRVWPLAFAQSSTRRQDDGGDDGDDGDDGDGDGDGRDDAPAGSARHSAPCIHLSPFLSSRPPGPCVDRYISLDLLQHFKFIG